jgi:hypothetical protein
MSTLNTVYQVLYLVLYQVLGMKYVVQSTCVPVVPGVQYARSHVGSDKLHFAILGILV